MRRIAVLTSGGDAPGMNAAIRAVVRSGISRGMEVYGVYRGYEGLIENDIRRLEWHNVGDIIYRGGTILQTARCERFHDDEWVEYAADNLKHRGIDSLVVIGGDGTYRGGLCLAKHGISVIGIPASIDNDLGYTDFTIGFNTAINTVLDLVTKIRDTSSSHSRATIIEVMGRHCGDLAIYAGITSGADVIMVPECEIPISEVIERVRAGKNSGKLHTVIIKAEGVETPLSELQDILEHLTGQETRTVVPGYIQRGGSPTAQDRLIASLAGARAIELIAQNDGKSYAIGTNGSEVFNVSLEEAVNKKRVFRDDIYDLANVLG